MLPVQPKSLDLRRDGTFLILGSAEFKSGPVSYTSRPMSIEELGLDPQFHPPETTNTHEYALAFFRCLKDNPETLGKLKLSRPLGRYEWYPVDRIEVSIDDMIQFIEEQQRPFNYSDPMEWYKFAQYMLFYTIAARPEIISFVALTTLFIIPTVYCNYKQLREGGEWLFKSALAPRVSNIKIRNFI